MRERENEQRESIIRKVMLWILFVMVFLSFRMDKMMAATSSGNAAGGAQSQTIEYQILEVNGDNTKVGRYGLNYTGNINYVSTPGGVADTLHYRSTVLPGFVNSSKATLQGDNESTRVVKAYLVWETRRRYNQYDEATNHVRFIMRDGLGVNIYPDRVYVDDRSSQYASEEWRASRPRIYCGVADVTNIVQAYGYGDYYVANIPECHTWDLLQEYDIGGGSTPTGWQLIVVEESDSYPVRAVVLGIGSRYRFGDRDFDGFDNCEVVTMDATLGSGLKTKTYGTVTGQVLFGCINSASNDTELNVRLYTRNEYGGYAEQYAGIVPPGAGMYRYGAKMADGWDMGVVLYDVSELDNGANTFGVQIWPVCWNTQLFIGAAVDLSYPDFIGEQSTVANSSSSVTVSGKFTNVASTQNTGIYDGNLTVTTDSALTPKSASAVVNGNTTIYGSISGNRVVFSGPEVASMMNGSNITYTVECAVTTAGKTRYDNSAAFHGFLCADGTQTGYWIDRLWTASSWGAAKCKVAVNKGTGISGVSGGGEYTAGTRVTVHGSLLPGYHWKNWTGSYNTAIRSYTFDMPAYDVTLTANAEANTDTPYKVKHYLQNIDGSGYTLEEVQSCKGTTDTTLTLSNLKKEYTGFTYHHGEVSGQTAASTTIKGDGSLEISLYYTRNRYTVTVNAGYGIESVNGSGTYYYGASVNVGAEVKRGYHWSGWSGDLSSETQNFSYTMPAQDIILTANARANSYTIHFEPNGGGEISPIPDMTVTYDGTAALPDAAGAYTKYTLDGENVTQEVLNGTIVLGADGVALTAEEAAELEAEAEAEKSEGQPEGAETPSEIETADGTPEETAAEEQSESAEQPTEKTDAVGEPEAQAFEEEEPVAREKAYASVFMGWALEDGKEAFTAQWTTGTPINVSELSDAAGVTETDGAVITLYAVWDDCPWITAVNLYYTLEQAQSGFITEEEILSHAEATDREDGSPILAGTNPALNKPEVFTRFSIPDYQEQEFTGMQHDGAVSENLTVTDSAGSTYRKRIMVYVVDTTPVPVKPAGTPRFINEHYYNQPYEDGGLEDESIWKTDAAYRTALLKAFDNVQNDTPEEVFEFTKQDILEMKQFIADNGFGNTKNEDALNRFYDRFCVPNRTE